MILSDLSIRRPVVCTVASILLVLIGALSFVRMPVREYPDLDVPAVSVTTVYTGAAAEVVESKITEPLEEQLATIDGIRIMRSVSREQVSQITIEFELGRGADEAANDVRDRVSRARGRLPDEVDEPIVSKIESDANPFIWIAFNSDQHSQLELTDFVDRIAKQRAQTVSGVGNVIIGGERRYSMRVWLKAELLAAYGLSSSDVEDALRRQNVDIPGGRIESLSREFTVRTLGDARTPEEFEDLVVATRSERQIKIRDIGWVELGAEDYRTRTFFNGRPAVGLGIVRQSKSNLLDVATAVKAILPSIVAEMPQGVKATVAYDTSVFVQRSVDEVYLTLGFAVGLVILVIFAFLRDWRATLVPLLAIPTSLIGSFFFLSALGFSVNILTLLALVLAVGLVVDDAIVVLENVYRRIELGEAPISAAVQGSRQVAFAVIATSLTLAAVFLPVAFQSGAVGRLFYEFGITLAVAVLVSSFVALTLTPMLCSRILASKKRGGGHIEHGWFYRFTEPFFEKLNAGYTALLRVCLRRPVVVVLVAAAFAAAGPVFFLRLQQELVPMEDRGNFLSLFRAPLGSTPDYTQRYVSEMDQIARAQPETAANFSVTALGRGTPGSGNEGLMFTNLKPWEERKAKTQEVIGRIGAQYAQAITGGLAFPVPRKPLGQRGVGEGIQFVLRGLDFNLLQNAADQILTAMRESGMFVQPRKDPSPNKPQLNVEIDRERAGDLEVSVREIASTLETLFGGREVTRFKRGNKEYEVIVRLEDADRVTPEDLGRVYVRARSGADQLVQLRTLVHPQESVAPESYTHFDRMRSVTILTQTAEGVALGDAVDFLQKEAARLPGNVSFAWDGEAREFVDGKGDVAFLFGLALLFTFLILAAQFESWVHPLTIYTGVALALAGGVFCLWGTRFFGTAMTDNLFSRFGLIMLIGLIAKNGILIVEFANQLQVQGKNAWDAAFEAASLRFRPILMTAISTIFGAVPIAFATGAGAETRNPLGTVVVGGMSIATLLTLFVVPAVYVLMDRLVTRVTGHSSAHGLKRAAEIMEEERRSDLKPAG